MSSLWDGFVSDVLLESVAVNIPQPCVRWKQPRRELLLSGPRPLFTHRVSLALVTSLLVLPGPALAETCSHKRALDSDGGEREPPPSALVISACREGSNKCKFS